LVAALGRSASTSSAGLSGLFAESSGAEIIIASGDPGEPGVSKAAGAAVVGGCAVSSAVAVVIGVISVCSPAELGGAAAAEATGSTVCFEVAFCGASSFSAELGGAAAAAGALGFFPAVNAGCVSASIVAISAGSVGSAGGDAGVCGDDSGIPFITQTSGQSCLGKAQGPCGKAGVGAYEKRGLFRQGAKLRRLRHGP
jgi:hypothetical protein